MALYIAFPFLIGRIKSLLLLVYLCFHSKFPFLIGRIKSEKISYKQKQKSAFPFLIGRIKSFFCPRYLILNFSVSIPYRQDKKCLILSGKLGILRVSIPYRQDKKAASNKEIEASLSEFPFLIGRIKSYLRYLGVIALLPVSIPYRQDKKFIIFFIFSRPNSFPFLIGRIKRKKRLKKS